MQCCNGVAIVVEGLGIGVRLVYVCNRVERSCAYGSTNQSVFEVSDAGCPSRLRTLYGDDRLGGGVVRG